MFRRGDISTETDKKPFLFTLIAFLGSLLAAILLFALGKGEGLAIFAGVLVAIVAIAAGIVLFAMVTDQAYIQDETLYMRYLFRKAEAPLKQIGKVTFKDQVYTVFDKKGNQIGTINGQLTGIDAILLKLDQSGVPFV